MSISDDRNRRFQERTDARVALFNHIKRDLAERSLTYSEIAEKHQISENTVRDILAGLMAEDSEVFKLVVSQLGTEDQTVITVVVPKGTTYREVVEQIRKGS